MTDNLLAMMWKQWPTGWHIRSLDRNGHYIVEILSEYPAYRHLTSGYLFPWDIRRILQLGENLLATIDLTKLPVQPASYEGFFSAKKSSYENDFSYYYIASPTLDPQKKLFLEMVAILDPYFSSLSLMLRCRSDLYEY